MKDIPRSEEGEGGRMRVFKEEMMRRAEETRSFMMTKSVVGDNGFGSRDFRKRSPTGSGHQSVIDIKIERENGTGDVKGKEFEVGKENYFKVNIENVSDDGKEQAFHQEDGFNDRTKNGINTRRENSDYVEKEIFLSGKNELNRNSRNGTREPETGFNVGGNTGFNVSIENGVKINIENNGFNPNQENSVGAKNKRLKDKFFDIGGQNYSDVKMKNGDTISEYKGNVEEMDLTGESNDMNKQNGLMSKRIPSSHFQNGENRARNNQLSQLDMQMEDIAMGNPMNQNSKARASSDKTNGTGPGSGPQFAKYDPRVNTSGAEECKCADREAEKAQLRELNDRHLLLLSEKQGVINCLLQKIETLTKIREVFVDEDREKLKKEKEFLENKIKDAENKNAEANKNDAIKDGQIEDLEKKIKDLESELKKNEENIKAMEDLKKENAILTSAKNADDEKMKWLGDERDHDRENFDNFIKKVFTEKWEEIIEKVEKPCDGKSYLDNVKNKLEELRNAFDDRSAFDDMEAKYKEQIEALHGNLEAERENTANTAGDNSEMKCKMDMLEEQLEALKKENDEAKNKLADEKIANAREIAAKDAEASHLKNLLPNLSNYGQLGGPGCINNIPVDLAQELGVYRKILDAVGEEKEKERVEEVIKRIVHSKETTTTYPPGHKMNGEQNGDIF